LVYTKPRGTWTRTISLPCLFILKQNKMESFEFTSAVCGYHIYKEIWEPNVGDKFLALRELHNQFDKYAIKVLNGEETVGHLPCEYSKIAWYFLACGRSLSVEVTGHRRRCKQLCGGMEIPCCVMFSCSRKATINRLKDLLTKKV